MIWFRHVERRAVERITKMVAEAKRYVKRKARRPRKNIENRINEIAQKVEK